MHVSKLGHNFSKYIQQLSPIMQTAQFKCGIFDFLDKPEAAHLLSDALLKPRALEEEEYEAAVADIRMPGLDGFGFLSRASEIRPNMPVIIVSGHASPDTMEEVLQARAFAFLAKLFRIKELDLLMKNICSLKES